MNKSTIDSKVLVFAKSIITKDTEITDDFVSDNFKTLEKEFNNTLPSYYKRIFEDMLFTEKGNL